MKTEIKNTVEDLITNVLNSVGDQVKGETLDTREEIVSRNLNVALIRISALLRSAKANIVTKMKGKSGEKALTSILNEEL